MTRSRFLTGSLASIAVASAFTLAAPAANAADERGCGQPAVDAVYSTVVHDAVFRTVPAQSHNEWLWQRDVDDYSYEYTKLVSPASVETNWTRQVAGPTEYLWTRTVTDVPAVPAVPGTPATGHYDTVVTTPAVVITEWEYEHQVTHKLRWESEDWGAQNGQGNGWVKTGNTRETVVTPAVTTQVWVVDSPATPGTPAVPAITHDESVWSLSSPGGDWTGPADSRPGTSTTENETTDGDAPAGDGWSLVATRSFDAVYDTVWTTSAPAGYDPTGNSKVSGSHHEQTDATSAAAPAGDGWSEVADSETTIVDVPESKELVSDGWTEQVLLSPALPATAPCVDPPSDDPTTDPGTPTTDVPTGDTAGPQAAPAAETSSSATVLPETGNGVPPWMAPTGLLAMLAGAALIRFSRRHGVR
ncbi:hypothetical protein [Nocardioides marmorisolisilvae]|nr:hypothetical protein [Nocardioides marmorisolisilvae]